MSAYVIVEFTVVDETAMQTYRDLSLPVIAQYGGRVLARASSPDQLDGDRASGEWIIVIEFASAETARRWYESDEYAPSLAIRDQAMTRRMTLVGE